MEPVLIFLMYVGLIIFAIYTIRHSTWDERTFTDDNFPEFSYTEYKHEPEPEPSIEPGSVVIFDINKEHLKNSSEEEKIKWYGSLGYGSKLHQFVYITAIYDKDGNDTGHCVLISLDDQHVETMRHTSDFRLATEKEF